MVVRHRSDSLRGSIAFQRSDLDELSESALPRPVSLGAGGTNNNGVSCARVSGKVVAPVKGSSRGGQSRLSKLVKSSINSKYWHRLSRETSRTNLVHAVGINPVR